MMKPQDSSATATAIATGTCGHCGHEERRFLHHVRHRGIFRRLCTNCLLRLHPHSFCPTCFAVYDFPTTLVPLPSNDAVACSKCYSSTHIACAGPAPANPYTCPLCANPNAPLFVLKDFKDHQGVKEIDKKNARVLVAAAKIASGTMNKAAVAAQAEAERRAKEANSARKRYKEAMEHLVAMEAEEKLKKDSGLGEIAGSGSCRSGIGNSVAGKLGENKLFGDRNGVGRLDSSSAVLAAFDAVELKEKERLVAVKAEIGGFGVKSDPMTKAEDSIQNNGHLNSSYAQAQRGSNGLLPVLKTEPDAVLNEDQLQYVQNNHARDGNVGSQQ